MLTKKTNEWTELHQFQKLPIAMMVIYLPVSLNSIGQSIFELESGNKNDDGQTNRQKRTNEQTELQQFRKEHSYDGDLSPCQV